MLDLVKIMMWIMDQFHDRLNKACDINAIPEIYKGRNFYLANALNVSTVSVTKWLKGYSVPKKKTITKIAKLLNVSETYLKTGKGKIERFNSSNTVIELPIIEMDALKKGTDISSISKKQQVYCPIELSSNAFITAQIGDLMSPIINHNSVLIMDSQKIKHDDICLILNKSSNKYSMKKIYVVEHKYYINNNNTFTEVTSDMILAKLVYALNSFV